MEPIVAPSALEGAYGGNAMDRAKRVAEAAREGGADASPSARETEFEHLISGLTDRIQAPLEASEGTAMSGLTGNASVQEVVEATQNAETAIKTITAIREKTISAYREILRMPI